MSDFEYFQTPKCNIEIIQCWNPKHQGRLEYLKEIAYQQREYFGKFLSIDEGCDSDKKKNFTYFVAFNEETNQLCGVAQTTLKFNTVFINYLSTRAHKNREQFKGIGTKILNFIKDLYIDSKLGIALESAPDAVGFYEKYGFVLTEGDLYYFYSFPKFISLDKQEWKNILLLCEEIGDAKKLNELINLYDIDLTKHIQMNLEYRLNDEQFFYNSPFFIENFDDKIGITEDEFVDLYLIPEYINIIIAYLKTGTWVNSIITDDVLIELIDNISVWKRRKLINALVDNNYKFTLVILFHLIENECNTEISKILPTMIKDKELFKIKNRRRINTKILKTIETNLHSYQLIYDLLTK